MERDKITPLYERWIIRSSKRYIIDSVIDDLMDSRIDYRIDSRIDNIII